MKKEFLIERQGKEFVLYAGLLDEAHAQGLKTVKTTLLQIPTAENGNTAICTAEVTTDRGTFCGIGDAAPENVSRLMLPHIIRFAETRAKARALRDAINVGVAAAEELGEEVPEEREPLTEKQMNYLVSLASQRGYDVDALNRHCTELFGFDTSELTKDEATKYIEFWKKKDQQPQQATPSPAAKPGNGHRDNAGNIVDPDSGDIIATAPRPAPATPSAPPRTLADFRHDDKPAATATRPAPAPSTTAQPAAGATATPAQVRAIYLIAADKVGWKPGDVQAEAVVRYGAEVEQLTKTQASEFIKHLSAMGR